MEGYLILLMLIAGLVAYRTVTRKRRQGRGWRLRHKHKVELESAARRRSRR
jgi:hypothetical protein